MRESKYSYNHTHEKKEVKLLEGFHYFKKFKERRREEEEEAAEFVCLSSSDFRWSSTVWEDDWCGGQRTAWMTCSESKVQWLGGIILHHEAERVCESSELMGFNRTQRLGSQGHRSARLALGLAWWLTRDPKWIPVEPHNTLPHIRPQIHVK